MTDLTKKLFTKDSIATPLATWRTETKKIVFTNGCFDILHHGHIHYLTQAKHHGDILIIGLNSDRSVSALKGPKRPINQAHSRAIVLGALDVVDAIVIFDEDTPIDLIQFIQPDIHVKGGDYVATELPEYPIVKRYGGQVIIEPFVEGFSTTGILDQLNS